MKLFFLLLVAVGYIYVSNGSYSDEIAAQNHYCDMVVKHNAWPNFKPEINCN
jgi:hypothetical protein